MKDDIIKLAKQCGHWSGATIEMNDVGIMDFSALVAEREREACAKLCEAQDEYGCQQYADAIRARGNT